MRERKPNTFEKILLVVGVAVLMVGYGLIHWQISLIGFTIDIIMAIFLWLMLVALIIIAAANENIKEETKHIIELQLQEIRLLREEVRRK
ncbi:hypothetical protein COV19_04735 [Candidatus Woesearchaeota archaeon CG10_big_fil_rev_8_21_14_0_10_44_13]|nr:MAG: hypothetical protein COV19_04735 [Candidatus Woesearchaeota archaeon CG10_big_fil_rev_8_21_14_0_10_44_13]